MRNGNPGFASSKLSLTVRSYRTYEEWKLKIIKEEGISATVLTVPMRNGNVVQGFVKGLSLLVLTVPMRNGNAG